MSKIIIYIPSKERSESLRTLVSIPQYRLPSVRVVVHDSEYAKYSESLGSDMVVATPAVGIANVRQWVLENAENEYPLFMDDDMDFGWRDEEGKIHKAGTEEVEGMLLLLESWLEEGFVHVGVSQRAGNNRCEEAFTEISRMNNIYAYNAKKALAAGGRFDRLQVMEDFDMTLTLLRAGLPNRVTFNYCWGQQKSGAAGGCSTYRTFEVQREAAFRLSQLHPGLVRVAGKRSKTEWEGIGGSRVDVQIAWKKAYNPKRQATSGGIHKFFGAAVK